MPWDSKDIDFIDFSSGKAKGSRFSQFVGRFGMGVVNVSV